MIKKIVKLYRILFNRQFILAIFKGSAAGTEHCRLLRVLDCNHVVDIGANRGQFALVSRNCFPDAMIDSFEPLTEPANIFENVFSHDSNIHLHRLAIGEKEGVLTIHVANRDDSSSLLPIGKEQVLLFPGTNEREQRTVRVSPLSAILLGQDIRSPALLKLDVQGYELEALCGCAELLGHFHYIYCECSFVELYEGQALAHKVIEYLSQRAFNLSGIYNMTYDKRGLAIQADFFFVNSIVSE